MTLYYKLKRLKNLLVSDKLYLRKTYRKNFGFFPNLDRPRRFTEISQWMKLYRRNPLHTTCADKYAVRDYIAGLGLSDILVPLLATGERWGDLQYQFLKAPFIIKATHGAGWNHIVRDKAKDDEAKLKAQFNYWLGCNLYYFYREWQYKNIPPRLIVEKLLSDEHGKVPDDIKCHCFNFEGGGSEIIFQIISDRFYDADYRTRPKPKAAFYDANWQRLPLASYHLPIEAEIAKPANFADICRIARQLSAPFPYVRVDLYNLNGQIFFGELTFSPDIANTPIRPDEWDFVLGNMLLKTGVLEDKTSGNTTRR